MNNQKREDGSLKIDGINDNTYNLLFKDYDNIPKEEQGSYENAIAFATIDYFTKLEEKKIFTKLLKLFYKNKMIDLDKITFNKETKQYEYKDNDLIINFDKLSNSFNDETLIKELMSNKRYGKCHTRTMTISPGIEGSRITTGYITIGNQKILHSIIEYDIEYDNNVKTIVLDWTRNLKISKEKYIELTNFIELSSFEGKKVLDDFDIVFKKLKMGGKPYLLFRDELMSDIKRNSHLFKSNEEEVEDNNIKRSK